MKYIKLFTSPCWIAILFFLLAVSCNKEIDQIDYTPEFAVPLFSSSSTLADFFDSDSDSSALVIAPDGAMMLVYRGNIFRRDAEEFFAKIPLFPGVMNDTVFSAPFTLENNINLIRASITSGDIFIQINSNVPEDVYFMLELPQVTKNGETFKIFDTLKYTGNLPVIKPIPLQSVAGYDIFLNGLQIDLRYVATKSSNGERVVLPAVGFLISNVTFSYLEGYFGYEHHQIDRDTIQMEIFKNILQGNLSFADPRVTFTVNNSFGFPLRCMVSTLRVNNDNQSADLMSPLIDKGFDFNYPSLAEVGKVSQTKFFFNRSNSNIKEILELYPTILDYQVDVISNPDTIVNFIGYTTDSSYMNLNVQVELPLHGNASSFEGDKIYDVEFSSLKNVIAAELKLVTENGMPLEIHTQATLLDENGMPLADLLNGYQRILKAAPINTDGYSTGISRQDTYIQADKALIDKMLLAKKLKVEARFNTASMGTTDVHIRSTDAVNLRMGLRATLQQKIGGQ